MATSLKPPRSPTHSQQVRAAAAELNRLVSDANEAGWEVEMSLGRMMSMSAGSQPVIELGRIYHRDGDYAEEAD